MRVEIEGPKLLKAFPNPELQFLGTSLHVHIHVHLLSSALCEDVHSVAIPASHQDPTCGAGLPACYPLPGSSTAARGRHLDTGALDLAPPHVRYFQYGQLRRFGRYITISLYCYITAILYYHITILDGSRLGVREVEGYYKYACMVVGSGLVKGRFRAGVGF